MEDRVVPEETIFLNPADGEDSATCDRPSFDAEKQKYTLRLRAPHSPGAKRSSP